MSISDLKKTKAPRVMGIDCSTNSLAYAIFENDKPVSCGEIFFNGADVWERLNDARQKTQIMVDAGLFRADYVTIESAVMVKNVEVAFKLAYVYGAVMSVIMQNSAHVNKVAPISWQSYIGNPILKTAEKNKIKLDFPGKSATWYQNKGREIRKQRTLDFARQFFTIADNSDNVGDAVGIAWWTSKVVTRR